MEHTITLLSQYGYLILFPIAVFEGPLATILAGLLVASGILNAFVVYPIVVLGDVLGDAGCYALGRWGSSWINRHGSKIGLTEVKLSQVRDYFTNNRKKALFFSKMLHGIGFAGLIVAGSLKITYRKFFFTCFTVSVVQSFIVLIVGILFGQAYAVIAKYLNYYAAISVVVVLIALIFFIVRKYSILKP